MGIVISDILWNYRSSYHYHNPQKERVLVRRGSLSLEICLIATGLKYMALLSMMTHLECRCYMNNLPNSTQVNIRRIMCVCACVCVCVYPPFRS